MIELIAEDGDVIKIEVVNPTFIDTCYKGQEQNLLEFRVKHGGRCYRGDNLRIIPGKAEIRMEPSRFMDIKEGPGIQLFREGILILETKLKL